MRKKKRGLLGKNSSLTVGTATATALAAVTTSIVSTQLNGVLNSLLLAAVISIVSAIAGEVYRNVIANTTERTKELLSEHTEIRIVGGDTDEGDAEPAVTVSVDDEAEGVSPTAASPKKGLRHYLQKNRYMQYVLVFSGVVILTTLINWWVFPDTNANYYYRTQQVTQQLTSEQTEDLLNHLREEIQNGELSVGGTATPTQEPSSPEEDTPNADVQEPNPQTVEQQLQELQTENDELSQQLADLQRQLEEATKRLTEIEGELGQNPTTPQPNG